MTRPKSKTRLNPNPKSRKYQSHELVRECFFALFTQRTTAAMQKMGLKPTNTPVNPLGSRPLDDGTTKNTYLSRLRSFVQFLLKHPEFDESLVIFRPDCPIGGAVCQEKAVSIFLLCQYQKKGTVVTTMEDPNKPILQKNGDPFLGTGKWNTPGACYGLRSALDHLHGNAHRLGFDYVERCEDCAKICRELTLKKKEDGEKTQAKKEAGSNINEVKLEGKEKRKKEDPVYDEAVIAGCQIHSHSPAPRRRGNVVNSVLVKDTIAYIHKYSQHQVRGANQLTPSDVRYIGNYCIASNDRYLYGLFALALLAIDLFLRKTEFSSLHEDNFMQYMSVISKGDDPDSLVFKVKGKGKRTRHRGPLEDQERYRYLHLWGDSRYPDICARRHLLAFLYTINWKGGYLFPSEEELKNPPPDGIYKTNIGEDDLCKAFSNLYKDVIGRSEKLGTHAFRKSGYLFHKLRGAIMFQLMQAANHECHEVVNRYYKAVDSFVETNSIIQDERQSVGEFRNPHCNGDENAVRQLFPCRLHQKPLAELVVGFIERVVGVNPSDERCLSPVFLAQKVMEWNPPIDPVKELKQHLRDIDKEKTSHIMACLNALKLDAKQAALAHHLSELALLKAQMGEDLERSKKELEDNLLAHITGKMGNLSSDVERHLEIRAFFRLTATQALQVAPPTSPPRPQNPSFSEQQTTAVTPSPSGKRRRGENRGGTKFLHVAEEFGKKSQEEQLNILLQIADLKSGEYIKKHRSFILRYHRAAHCLKYCCQANESLFIQTHTYGGGWSLNKITETNKLKNCGHCHKIVTQASGGSKGAKKARTTKDETRHLS